MRFISLVLTGHSYCAYHKHVIDPTISEKCRFCGESQEDTWHLTFQCPALTQTRYLALSILLPDLSNIDQEVKYDTTPKDLVIAILQMKKCNWYHKAISGSNFDPATVIRDDDVDDAGSQE